MYQSSIMAVSTEQQTREKKDNIYYITELKKLGNDFKNSLMIYNTTKLEIIHKLRDTFLSMKQDGHYDKPLSSICASICEVIREAGGGDNSDAYVRMTLSDEYKDTKKTTVDVLIKRALRVKSVNTDTNALLDDEGRMLNPFEEFSKEELNFLLPDEVKLLREEYLDMVKEGKRRARENKKTFNEILDEDTVNATTDIITNNKLFELTKILKSIMKMVRTINNNGIKEEIFTPNILKYMLDNALEIQRECVITFHKNNLK